MGLSRLSIQLSSLLSRRRNINVDKLRGENNEEMAKAMKIVASKNCGDMMNVLQTTWKPHLKKNTWFFFIFWETFLRETETIKYSKYISKFSATRTYLKLFFFFFLLLNLSHIQIFVGFSTYFYGLSGIWCGGMFFYFSCGGLCWDFE